MKEYLEVVDAPKFNFAVSLDDMMIVQYKFGAVYPKLPDTLPRGREHGCDISSWDRSVLTPTTIPYRE